MGNQPGVYADAQLQAQGMQTFQQAGGIFLITQQQNYHSSQIVNGTIYLNLTQPTMVQGIYLTFAGYERVFWEQEKTREVEIGQNPDGTTRYRTEHYMEQRHANRQFFNSRMLVHNYNGPAAAGQYQFNFSFALPEELPGDFHEERRVNNTDGYRASIEYTLTAECAAPGWRNDIISVQPIVVDEALRGSLQPISQEKTAKVRFCCCIPRGDARMRVTYDKNCYMPGETAQIICEVENRSKVQIRHINVQFDRTLTLRDDYGHSWTINERLFEQQYPGVPAGESALDAAARYVPIQIISEKHGLLQPQTSRGRFVQCRYFVTVEYDIPWCPDISIKIPVEIYQLCQPNWGIQQMPAFWQPAQDHVYVQQVAFDYSTAGPALQHQQ